MCGAFSVVLTPSGWKQLFGLEAMEYRPPAPIYNARPGETLPLFTQEHPKEISLAMWKYVPHWMKESNSKGVINARGETVAVKPYFRSSFKSKRCIIPADGFYEWDRKGKFKIPYRFVHKDKRPFGFAGLYDELPDNSGLGFVIITTNANELVGKIHDRMPVMFDRDEEQAWLNPQSSAKDLQELIRPYPAEQMTMFEVSRAVNNSRNKDASVIRPVSATNNLR